MNPADVKLLNDNGWTVECESPFEIRHTDGSFATHEAARLVLEYLKVANTNVYDSEENKSQKDGRCHAHCMNGCQYKVYGKCLSEEDCKGQYVKTGEPKKSKTERKKKCK